MVRRVLLCSWVVVALAAPSFVSAKRVLVVTDPHSSTKPATLLEFAIAEELRNNADTIVLRPTEASPKHARAVRFANQANNLRENGRRQFEQLELDVALKQLSKAVQKLDKAMPMLEDIRPLLDTLEMLSATLLLLGQERRARTSLERLLVLDVNASPDEAVFNPQMIAVFDAVVSRVRGGPAFDVEVTVDPPGAAVFFDGRLVGVAPATIKEVRRGRHYVSAALKGFDPIGRAVELKPRSSHSISLKLSESKRSSRAEVAATACVAAIDDEVMPTEAQDLVDTFSADLILLVESSRTAARLVSYDADGSNRYDKSSSTRIDDLASARRTARALLGPLARPIQSSEDGTTGVAATDVGDDGYGDDFGDGDTEPPRTVAASGWDNAGSSGGTSGGSSRGGGFHLFSSDPTKERLLYATYGGGVVLGAVGGVFGYLGLAAQQEYYRETKLKGGKIDHDGTTDQIEGEEVAIRGRRNGLIADILFGTAIFAIVTGVVLHFAWNPSRPQTTTTTPGASSTSDDSPDSTNSPGDGGADSSGEGWDAYIGPGFIRIDF